MGEREQGNERPNMCLPDSVIITQYNSVVDDDTDDQPEGPQPLLMRSSSSRLIHLGLISDESSQRPKTVLPS